MKPILILCGVLAAGLVPAGASADVLEPLEANMKAIHQYEWTTLYRVSPEDGDPVVVYAAARFTTTGTVLQTVAADNLSEEGQEIWDGTGSASGGEEETRMKLSEVAKLIYAYGYMTPAELEGFLADAETSDGEGDLSGTTAYRSEDVLHEGDEVTLWIDGETGLSRKLTFSAVAADLPFQATADYHALEDGGVVIGGGNVTVPDGELTVEFEVSAYHHSN